ncbi:response regulator transcription factor [Paenibacillus hexagrammi]|uniref:Helix-turn-helix transcriptional regulator n=1 Tax=Paenibacillus hexagrammi TaxID=2908839 RepID=A0ABY3SFY9_9BACL|nr:helix-turn-helix transcriptional regulator [Paenibacillus sp. YPD9-1]UJF32887.1 helix-turn-helix transcriptional regulator [Paenibacillus sp. YPD9-1]
MKLLQISKLQGLQDAYASLCHLTIITIDEAGRPLTELSGEGLSPEHLLEDKYDLLSYLAALTSPIVYENEVGLKMIAAPITGEIGKRLFVLAGVWREAFEPAGALMNAPIWQAADAAAAMNQITCLAQTAQSLLQQEVKEKKHAERLQLLRMLSLLPRERESKDWLESVIHIFLKISELQFAGFAAKGAGERYVLQACCGELDGLKRLVGASFYTGEGLLGHAALTQTLGYWEELDEDPRSSLFTEKGIKVQLLIAYPIHCGGQRYGILFGGSGASSGLSEETADLGGLLAGQLANDLHHLRMQAQAVKEKKLNRALLELSQAMSSLTDPEDLSRIAVQFILRDTGAAMAAVRLKMRPLIGLDRQEGELLGAYTERAPFTVEQRRALKPQSSEWKGKRLIEVSFMAQGECKGLIAAAFDDAESGKEACWFLEMAGQLLAHRTGSHVLSIPIPDQEEVVLSLRPIGTDSYTVPVITAETMPPAGQLHVRSFPAAGVQEKLTSREAEVLNLVIQGLSNTQIAERLCISAHTVKNHMTKIFDKLGVADRTQTLAMCLQSSIGSISC